MALQTPTTKEISDNIIAQLEASLNQTIPLLPKSFMRVLAKALAAVFITLYKYAGFSFLQMFITTASDQVTTVNGRELVPLTEWGRTVGVGDPVQPVSAQLNVEVTVTSQGGTLGVGSQLVSADNGITYSTLSSVLLDAPTVIVTAIAAEPGVVGNLESGAALSFVSPLAGVARAASVDSQAVTGSDVETTASYRQRILDRFQKPPQGGAYADYEQWAEAPTGTLNAYPYASDCPGQVDVYIESSTEVDGIPTTAQLQESLDSINQSNRRPVNALVQTLPITRTYFDVEVEGLQVDDIATVQSDITTAVEAYFLNREPYIGGLTVPPRTDRITQSGVAGVVDSVVSASGGVFTSAVVLLGAIPTPLYSLGIGEKAKADSVVFT